MKSWSASSLETWVRAFGLVIAIAVLAGGRAQAQAPSLDQLLAQFRAVPGLECRFHEEKQIALLTMPITSEGTVHYARPSRLVRRITSPSPQIVLVDAGRLQMSEGGRVETIDLASQPVVRSFVETFARLLAGDRAALEATYAMEYAPSSSGSTWTLTLRPRSAPLDRFLREIRFEGDGTSLRRMVMSEVSGDVTTTTFSDVVTNRRYSTDEAARIFSLR